MFKAPPQTAEWLSAAMKQRGLSTEGQVADGTECLDCIQTHPDQANVALERDVRMEVEFAASEAQRLGERPSGVAGRRSPVAQGSTVHEP